MAPLKLVLASASPRRSSLLQRLGLELVVAPMEVDESAQTGELPLLVALRLAQAKAQKAQARYPQWPVLAADTVVVLDGRVLGKPSDKAEAQAMLSDLRGRTHLVVTAVVLAYLSRQAHHVEVAKVTFSRFPRSLLAWYLAGEEWKDKAGAYAIQGQAALFVAAVQGNVQAVVGLPLAPLPTLFSRVGLALEPVGNLLSLVPRNTPAPPAPASESWQRCDDR
ncbi:MAG: Maf family protein [Thermoanaerobaculaceae bacterium]